MSRFMTVAIMLCAAARTAFDCLAHDDLNWFGISWFCWCWYVYRTAFVSWWLHL